jgi:hypothetical protein
VRVGRVLVLQDLAGAFSARRLQQRFQLVERFFVGGLLRRKAVGVQADQDRPVYDDLFFFHASLRNFRSAPRRSLTKFAGYEKSPHRYAVRTLLLTSGRISC